MRTKHLVRLAVLNASLALGLSAWGIWLWSLEAPSLTARPVLPWDPAGSLMSSELRVSELAPSLSEALARPLFQVTRRPFVPEAAPVEAPAAAPITMEVAAPPPAIDVSQFTLKGLLILPGQKRALIATADAPDGLWVEPGTNLSGWTVKSMDDQSLVVVSGKAEAVLKLYVDKPPN